MNQIVSYTTHGARAPGTLLEVILAYVRDNVRALHLRAEGQYERITPTKGETGYRGQQALLELHSSQGLCQDVYPDRLPR